MSRRSRAPILAVCCWLGASAAAHATWKDVPVDIALPPKVRTEPQEKLLVTMFRGTAHERIDVGLEMSRWLRREVARVSSLRVLDVPPPEIPEQRPEKLAVNDAFWRRLGEDFHAELIVAGIAEFHAEDRSGFISEDVESPVTGQTVRRTRFAERHAYVLRVTVFFLKGDNGALLHREVWTQERVVDGTGEDLQQLYDLLEEMRPRLAATLLPTKMQEPRFIWID